MVNQDNKNLKILVIDDTKEMQQLIKMCLEMINQWSVITAESGLHGIEIAEKENNLDLILLDYLMPKHNGEFTIKKLRSIPKISLIPVIFLTAQSDEKINWKKLGAKGVIYKPFNPLDLGCLIQEIL